jgi:magnesium-transporting ATPase (P-type)
MIMIMGLIGRFYEQKFQYKTGSFILFILAAILFICPFLDLIIGGNDLIKLIMTLATLLAAVLSTQLYLTMTGAGR